jgi:hypothetical protein
MGQYHQWLSAQEAERRLRGEVETLETELLYLRDRIAILEQSVPVRENSILQALLAQMQGQLGPAVPEGQTIDRKPSRASWSGLPRLETPRLPETEMTASERAARLNEDVLAFYDRSRQTEPRLPASEWGPHARLRATQIVGMEQEMDEETRRLNEDIQRWFVRWHRQITGTEQAEVQHE